MNKYEIDNLPYGEIEVTSVFVKVECPYCSYEEIIGDMEYNYFIHNCGNCAEDYEVNIKLNGNQKNK